MTTEKTKKNEKIFCCNFCYFNTSKKTDYVRHITTQKHKNNVLTTDDNGKNEKNEKKHICENCDKEYNDRAGLWRHKKKCQETSAILHNNEPTDKELIMMLVKQNTELLEVIKNGTHNTISNNTNSLNKTFNLQFFLNETCKDAMNIMDFVDSIKLQLTDLEKVGEIGYVEGISNIITTNLQALDVTQRPIHCTDKKRETLYIKDEDKWEKENEEKKKIRKVVKKVADKNIMLLQKFKELHPDCIKSASKFSDQYNKLIIESMDTDKENENKIIKNITKTVTIDK
jgi:hypothetical protein